MAVFKINEKTYTAKPLDFNAVCDLEDMGIPVEYYGKKFRVFQRAYFAYCANVDLETAGKEMESHIKNGGDFAKLLDCIENEIEKSDFFRTLFKRTAEENPTQESEKVEAE